MAKKWPKIDKNGQKMAKNGKTPKMAKMGIPDILGSMRKSQKRRKKGQNPPKTAPNPFGTDKLVPDPSYSGKNPKKGQKWPKMAKNGSKPPKTEKGAKKSPEK
jgi:hypothetical protein